MSARAELMLMLAARAQHVAERIRPALEAGHDVVVDRFSGSTLAYQGYGRGLPLGAITDACDLATGALWPDLNILLDVPLEVAAKRRMRNEVLPDRIESEDEAFHARVAEGFQALAAGDPRRWFVIDATGEVDDIARLVRQAVAEVLDEGGRR
jgi:dTMP kinase